ncbi:MAG: helix-turn-helix domain-containing protein, partial [Bacteroidales bacterium]|nr:helix-turn-helix domain-containing protein [Bacteroidales bacterium]
RAWHYHPEAELLLITKGYGKRFVGDSVEDFGIDDLVLLGKNLPHAWISDPVFYEPGTRKFCKSIYLQFNPDVFGEFIQRIPEIKTIHELLNFSERGISIHGQMREEVIRMVKRMPGQQGIYRFLDLINILELISKCELRPLSSKDYLTTRFYSKSTRINHVHEYIMENFKQEIPLKTAADIACMNESSFARFFKIQTGKTFSGYLNEVRLDFACRLLQGTELSITRIAYESGYNSLAYFNKRFREMTGSSPQKYRFLNNKG